MKLHYFTWLHNALLCAIVQSHKITWLHCLTLFAIKSHYVITTYMISTTLCNSNCNQITLRSNYLHDLLFTAACTHYAAMTALCAAMTVLQWLHFVLQWLCCNVLQWLHFVLQWLQFWAFPEHKCLTLIPICLPLCPILFLSMILCRNGHWEGKELSQRKPFPVFNHKKRDTFVWKPQHWHQVKELYSTRY